MALPRSLGKGSGKKGSGEVRGQDFKGIVTLIRRQFLYANIGGLDLQILFNKCTGNSVEFKYLDPGVTIYLGLSLISPGGNLSRS